VYFVHRTSHIRDSDLWIASQRFADAVQFDATLL
jgi:hypothetical protein